MRSTQTLTAPALVHRDLQPRASMSRTTALGGIARASARPLRRQRDRATPRGGTWNAIVRRGALSAQSGALVTLVQMLVDERNQGPPDAAEFGQDEKSGAPELEPRGFCVFV